MRRASPSPPKKVTDQELEKLRPHQIDERLAEHVEWVERLEREADPGAGLAPKKAATARQRQLNRLESAVAEVDRLAKALPAEPDRHAATRKKERILFRRAIEDAPRSEEERKGMRELHEGMAEQTRKREQKSKLHKLSDRRRHPRDPRASSVLAAVVSSDFLAEALELKLRSNIRLVTDGVVRDLADDEYVSLRLLQPGDVVVLYLAALSIEQGGLLAAGEPANRGLHELHDVADSLRRLGWTGILAVRRESDRRWRVSWGERAIKIAAQAGVKILPPVVEEPVEGVLTRS
jgi:hypothetical protein